MYVCRTATGWRRRAASWSVTASVKFPRMSGCALLCSRPSTLTSTYIRAVRAGASGFLLKDTPPEQLLEAIRTVHRGDAVIAPSATRRLLEQMIPVLDSPAVAPVAPAAPVPESAPVAPPATSELPKATFIPADSTSFEPVADYPHRELIEQLSPREFEVLGLIARGLSMRRLRGSWYFRKRR